MGRSRKFGFLLLNPAWRWHAAARRRSSRRRCFCCRMRHSPLPQVPQVPCGRVVAGVEGACAILSPHAVVGAGAPLLLRLRGSGPAGARTDTPMAAMPDPTLERCSSCFFPTGLACAQCCSAACDTSPAYVCMCARCEPFHPPARPCVSVCCCLLQSSTRYRCYKPGGTITTARS